MVSFIEERCSASSSLIDSILGSLFAECCFELQENDGNKVVRDIIHGPCKKKYRYAKVVLQCTPRSSMSTHFCTDLVAPVQTLNPFSVPQNVIRSVGSRMCLVTCAK